MSDVHEVGRIQINEDLAFLRKEWRVQRIGWVAMLLVTVLGLAGALGRGPLAAVDAGDRNTLSVSYERIVRHAALTEVRLTVGPALPQDTTLRVFISARYMERMRIMEITPRPAGSGASGEFIYYDFVRLDPASPSGIVFQLEPQGYWRTGARVTLRGAQPVVLNQVILP